MQGEKKPTMKKAVVMSVSGIILVFAASLSLVGAAFMQGNGASNGTVTLTVLIGFFGGNAAAIFLFGKAYPILLLHDCTKFDKRYDEKELSELYLPDRTALLAKLTEQKFRLTKEGYYQKKVLSLSKDKLCYLFRVTEDYDIENAFRRETERLSKIKIKCQNLCMILLVYMDQMGEYEKKALKDLCKANVVIQTVNPKISASALMVAVDSDNHTGYFLDVVKNNFSLYAYGCRLVKKLFGRQAEEKIVSKKIQK